MVFHCNSRRCPGGALVKTLALLALMLTGSGARAALFDSPAMINKAIELIEAQQYALARTYLAPALIHHRLGASARSHAYYLRGYSYYAQQLYVSARKDYYRALEFDEDNAVAQAALARLYFYGEGTPKDPVLGLQLYRSAAAKDNKDALFHLGYALIHGIGAPQDLQAGRTQLLALAEAGDTAAMTHLAASYRKALTTTPEPALALEWYDRAIARNDAGAMVAKAYLLSSDELETPDPASAKALLERAAASGNANARINLSYRYLIGDGVPVNPDKAYQLLSEAAHQNVPELHFRLGHLHQYGLGTPVDLDAAIGSFQRAAMGGISAAMTRLAYLLINQGDDQSQTQAGYWLAQATQSNAADAYNEYAWFLATHPLASVRNGKIAIANARKAVALEDNPNYLDTLAAAYAEAGRFDEAISTQQQALALAKGQDAELIEELTAHLKAYEAGQPWREEIIPR